MKMYDDGSVELSREEVSYLTYRIRRWEQAAKHPQGTSATDALVDLGCDLRHILLGEGDPGWFADRQRKG